jgi:hypothetical protein
MGDFLNCITRPQAVPKDGFHDRHLNHIESLHPSTLPSRAVFLKKVKKIEKPVLGRVVGVQG